MCVKTNDFSNYEYLYLEKCIYLCMISPIKMHTDFTGREKEIAIFDKLLKSTHPEFLVVYGRRRVGKTYLIRQYTRSRMVFDFTGAYEMDMYTQLDNFFAQYLAWTNAKRETIPPKNWATAFRYLAEYLRSIKRRKTKLVVFIDELPWLDTPRSKFVSALEYFWNQHGSKMNNLLLVTCGSTASWMHKKLLKAKGGLYNRVTQRIHLKPFTLSETERYCRKRKLKFTRYQIIQLYMVMGGIPFYLKELTKGKSVNQLIDEICLSPSGLLADEYEQLYHSLFKNAEDHMAIIEALGSRPNGIVRNDLVQLSGLIDGGTFNRALTDLVDSGFVEGFRPFGKKKKDTVYKLVDLYTLFYIKYIRGNVSERSNTWESLSSGNSYTAWSGYAYENVCMAHIDQILAALGIGGMHVAISSWRFRGDETLGGAQVDLLIDRKDGLIHLCEAKFTRKEFAISKDYISKLRHKRSAFEYATKTKKQVVTSLFTTYPAIQNKYYLEEVHSEVNMDSLFGVR